MRDRSRRVEKSWQMCIDDLLPRYDLLNPCQIDATKHTFSEHDRHCYRVSAVVALPSGRIEISTEARVTDSITEHSRLRKDLLDPRNVARSGISESLAVTETGQYLSLIHI